MNVGFFGYKLGMSPVGGVHSSQKHPAVGVIISDARKRPEAIGSPDQEDNGRYRIRPAHRL